MNATVTDLTPERPAAVEPEVVVAPQLAEEIEGWLSGARDAERDGLRLARLVTCQVRRHGRHRLGAGMLAELQEVQDRYRGADAYLDAFLDAVLARHQDRFRNQTYLALPLIEAILNDPASGLDPERMSALIIADVVRHESEPVPAETIDPSTTRKRIRHAARFVATVDPTIGEDLPTPPATRAAEWFALAVQPVSVVHDEYFFIRALQAHEMVFTTLTSLMHGATTALRAGRIRIATARVLRAGEVFERAAMLFRLVATMRAEDFHAFREFTEGASAIQSEAYKRFELACGRPSAARLASDAFTNVPAVRAEASQRDNLTHAFRDMCAAGRVDESARQGMECAIARLEAGHQRWKTTHHGLAAKMLGDAHGSGYTAGVPYLRSCLDNRLFSTAESAGCPMAAS